MRTTEYHDLVNAFSEHRSFIGEVYSRALPNPNFVDNAVQDKIKAGFALLKGWEVLNSHGKLCDSFRKVLADVAQGRDIAQFTVDDCVAVVDRYREWYRPNNRSET
jgi:hypothetical protein